MRVLLLFLAISAPLGASAQVILDGLTPSSGPPGTSASLFGLGFQGNPQIQLNGLNAAVTLNNATQVNFTVPANAASGFVAIGISNVWYTNPIPFTVTRSIQGTFNPPGGLSRSNYLVIADGEFVAVDAASGVFTGAVEKANLALLQVLRSELDPEFLALVPPQTNQPVVDAASTAEALVLLMPGLNARALEIYTNRVVQLRALPEFAALTNRLVAVMGTGRDYLDDASVQSAWLAAVNALLAVPLPRPARVQAQGFEDGLPRGMKLRYLDPPDTSRGNVGSRRLKVDTGKLQIPNSHHPDDFRLPMVRADRFVLFDNPLDWSVEVFALDPSQFQNGFADIDALGPFHRPAKMRDDAVETATVQASLRGKNINLIGLVASEVTKWLFSSTVDKKILEIQPHEFELSAVRPGVYIVEAYSGNLNNGSSLGNGTQSELISKIGGNFSWTVAAGANIFIGAVDALSAAGGGFLDVIEKTTGKKLASGTGAAGSAYFKICDGVARDVTKALAIHANHPLTLDIFYDYLKSGLSSLIKNIVNQALKFPEAQAKEQAIKSAAAKSLKRIVATFDVLSRVSNGAQAAERLLGLLHADVLAVERTVIVIGDPFSPRITSFLPTSGRGGEVLTIQGYNFSSDTNEMQVSFRQFPNTADPTDFDVNLPVEVIAASPNTLAVRVPTNGAISFPNRRAYVVVQRGTNELISSSAGLAPPYQEFTFLGLPVITSVFPSPARPGGLAELRGNGFDGSPGGEYRIYFDGLEQDFGRSATDSRLLAKVPAGLTNGPHTVAIRLRDYTSPAFTFQVQPPAYDVPHGTPGGYGIVVNQPDLSDTRSDHRISVLEAFLITGVGHDIEQHPDCEKLNPADPGYCPPQPRETDYVSGDEPDTILGPVNTIQFLGGQVFAGRFLDLANGDRYIFGHQSGTNYLPFVIDGGGGAGPGLMLDGTSEVSISGRLVIRNFNGHGVHLRNGANGNYLAGITVENCTGHGFFIEGNASGNELHEVGVTNVGGHGIYFTGAGATLNSVSSSKGNLFVPSLLAYDVIANCGGSGIRLDGGAIFNDILPGTIRNCQAAGLYLAGVSNNFIGRPTEELRRHFNLVNNQGPGAYLGPGTVGNVLRYLNPIGNHGDGVLLEGAGCSSNIVDRTYAGVNLYEGGTARTIPNLGNGIHLTAGAQFNLIGTRVAALGEHGSISGNRDNGILIEGANTAFNTLNAQNIGVLDPGLIASILKFYGNGASGIALRGGTHDNIIGDANSQLANAIYACPVAGIEIAEARTDRNLIFGNQIGSYFKLWVQSSDSPDRCRNGIWIHDGPIGNTIGLPGGGVSVPRFPGDTTPTPYQVWNAINTCSNAGVLVEGAFGVVGTDGILTNANVIQGNHIGELDTGGLAPSGEGAGIKLGAGAEANIIGGSLPAQGNRIRGWFRAGIWIDQNPLDSPRLRNRIENNFIEGPGLGISFRFTDYLTTTPSGGIGVLVTDSSGHQIGESSLTQNTLQFNRLGVYLANSSSNVVRGFFITNSYNAGLVIRGGVGNQIGGNTAGEGNRIHAFGFPNEPNWAGLALSQTTGNQVRANEIGHLASGRGAVGMFLTNAANNEIGGPSATHGNVIVSNLTHGVVISGPGSTGNQFLNNLVGRDREGKLKPNGGDGLRIEAGAHDNVIGGLADVAVQASQNFASGTVSVPLFGALPVGNIIVSNLLAGVRVISATSLGNRILYNDISGNGLKGIQHENGGNHLQPPPVFLAFDGEAVSGKVANLGITPPGSTVQIFTDPAAVDPEGDAFVGESDVQTNGTWRVPLTGELRHPFLTMTATHGGDHSTSEFGTGIAVPTLFAFQIKRTDSALQGSLAAGANNAAVFRLSLSAVNGDARVTSMSFDASGTLPDATAVSAARLYRDADGDGFITAADFLLGGPVTFSADNGRITFAGLSPVIEANSTQAWVVACSLVPGAPTGSTFQLTLGTHELVSSEFVNPLNLNADAMGSFPIGSANFTVTAAPPGQTFAAWAASLFTPQQLADSNISGPAADPDGDLLNNFGEYAFNLNPLVADRNTLPTGDRGIPHAFLDQANMKITFIRRKEPADVLYVIEQSTNLQNWIDALAPPPLLVLDSQVDVGVPGTVKRVTYRMVQATTGGTPRFVRVRAQPKP